MVTMSHLKALVLRAFLIRTASLGRSLALNVVLPLIIAAAIALFSSFAPAPFVDGVETRMPDVPWFQSDFSIWTRNGGDVCVAVVSPNAETFINDFDQVWAAQDVLTLAGVPKPRFCDPSYSSQAAFDKAFPAQRGSISAAIIIDDGLSSYTVKVNDELVTEMPQAYASSSEFCRGAGAVLAVGMNKRWRSTSGFEMDNHISIMTRQSSGVDNKQLCPADDLLKSGFVLLQLITDQVLIAQSIPNHDFQNVEPTLTLTHLPKPAIRKHLLILFLAVAILFVLEILSFSFLSFLVVEEKSKRIKPLLTVMGVSDFEYFASWMLVLCGEGAVFMAFLALGLVVFQAFKNTHILALFVPLVAAIMGECALMILFSTFLWGSVVGLVVASYLNLFLIAPAFWAFFMYSLGLPMSEYGNLFVSLLSPAAFGAAWLNLLIMDQPAEGGGKGLVWTFTATQNAGYTWPLWAAVSMMILFDSVLYFLLALYLEKVLPKPVGRREPLLYCFKRRSHNAVKNVPDAQPPEEHLETIGSFDTNIVEPPFPSERVAIRIRNLSKNFRSCIRGTDHWALRDFSLDIYHDEITAILGHNGAGKSTLLKILTGLMTPTDGTASIHGYDINDVQSLGEIHKMMGVCPQEDIFSDALSVRDHLDFFAAIRGIPKLERKQEIEYILEKIGLEDKAESVAADLSGGQRRRLAVGIAIIGGPKIIILDEPTAGVDPVSRRKLWELLKSLRSGRTMLLTTHYMDEADALADRKALLSNGMLTYAGTSKFLREKFNIGYKLEVNLQTPAGNQLQDSLAEKRLETLIRSILPDAQSNADKTSRSQANFTLPAQAEGSFPELFEALDKEVAKGEGGLLKNYGLSLATLEDIFLEMADRQEEQARQGSTEDSESNPTLKGWLKGLRRPATVEQGSAANTDENRQQAEDKYEVEEPRKEIQVYLPSKSNAFKALLKVRWLQIKCRPGATLLAVLGLLLVPMAIFHLVRLGNVFVPKATAADAGWGPLSPSNWKILPGTIWYQTANPDPNNVRRGLELLGLTSMEFTGTYDSILSELQNSSTPAARLYIQEAGDGAITLYFDTAWTEMPAAAINLMSNMKLKFADGSGEITTSYVPLPRAFITTTAPTGSSMTFFACVFFLFTLGFLNMPKRVCLSIVHEQESGIRTNLRMNGVTPLSYYAPHLLLNWCLMAFPLIIGSMAGWALTDRFLGVTTIVMFLALYIPHCMVQLLFAAGEALFFRRTSTAALVFTPAYVLLNFMSLVPMIVLFPLAHAGTASESLSYKVVNIVLAFLVPHYTDGMGLFLLAQTYFRLRKSQESVSVVDFLDSLVTPLYLAVPFHFLVLSYVLAVKDRLVTDESLQQAMCVCRREDRAKSSVVDAEPKAADERLEREDSDVFEERMLVEGITERIPAAGANNDQQGLIDSKASVLGIIPTFPTMLVHNLWKTYLVSARETSGLLKLLHKFGFSCGKKLQPVLRGVTFHVKQGEIFGLLGPNGAGKTTAIRLMGAEQKPTYGEIFINGKAVLSSHSDALLGLGFCPQSDALWEEFNIRQHLECFAMLRGLGVQEAKHEIDRLLSKMNITDHDQTAAIRELSGGTKRKVSFLISIFHHPAAILLDEPTTGLDPVSRRRLWDVVESEVRGKIGTILTTHSMEEADVLSDRVGILANGAMKCIGTPQHLRTKYASSYSADIWIDPVHSDIDALIIDFTSNLFPGAEFREYSLDKATFWIPWESVAPLSVAFKKLQNLKKSGHIVAYSLTQETLEAVFLRVIQ